MTPHFNRVQEGECLSPIFLSLLWQRRISCALRILEYPSGYSDIEFFIKHTKGVYRRLMTIIWCLWELGKKIVFVKKHLHCLYCIFSNRGDWFIYRIGVIRCGRRKLLCNSGGFIREESTTLNRRIFVCHFCIGGCLQGR